MRKPSEDHSFHFFFSFFCGDGGVGVGGGGGACLAPITRQRHRGVNKKNAKQKPLAPATIRHIVPFSCYANETSQHVGN